MARIDLTDDLLTVTFTPTEKFLGLLRNFSAPRSAVTSATTVKSWREVRGVRMGLAVPGRRKLGTWRSPGHRQLVDLRRGVPAVRIALVGAPYDELVISTPDAERLATELTTRSDGETSPRDRPTS